MWKVSWIEKYTFRYIDYWVWFLLISITQLCKWNLTYVSSWFLVVLTSALPSLVLRPIKDAQNKEGEGVKIPPKSEETKVWKCADIKRQKKLADVLFNSRRFEKLHNRRPWLIKNISVTKYVDTYLCNSNDLSIFPNFQI